MPRSSRSGSRPPRGTRGRRSSAPAALAVCALLAVAASAAPAQAPAEPAPERAAATLWPEEQRAFFQDGPALLLPAERRRELAALSEAERAAAISAFLDRDPLPETSANELLEGIHRRQRLVLSEMPSFGDDRARLLFLHGPPRERQVIDCGTVFVPMEVWTYAEEEAPPAAASAGTAALAELTPLPPATAGAGEEDDETAPGRTPLRLVLYEPGVGQPYRLWRPLDGKRALYTPEVEYWLEQWEELHGSMGRVRRVDLRICKQTRGIDQATGVAALTDYRPGRPTEQQLAAWLAPPADLAGWARAAAATQLPDAPPPLPVDGVEIDFPKREGQRMVGRIEVVLPAGAGAPVPAEVSGEPRLHFEVQGVVEEGGKLFDRFKVRYRLPVPGDRSRLALVFERRLRPDAAYLLRFTVRDEGSGAASLQTLAFAVPAEPRRRQQPPAPDLVTAAADADDGGEPAGTDALVLLPPEGGVALNVWRAEALVSGSRIAKVVFSVDGEQQLVRTKPPYTVEVRLARLPAEQVVRAAGYDAAGELVASDEVTLNQPRGSLRVRVVEPPRGTAVSGEVLTRAEVVVPEERRVVRVEFRLNDELVATLGRPPWETRIEVPPGDELAYLTVSAELDDGTRAEDVRFLNNPGYGEEVDVNLVELYVAVQDGAGRPVRGLDSSDFEVFDQGARQQITKFELMEALPLSLGIVIDTSGSMSSSLGEAQAAATEFLRRVVGPRDRTFAIAFASSPVLLMPPTDDVDAVAEALSGLRAYGETRLHDALVMGLSYFRDLGGQQALVLLSDGDDTASSFSYDEVLEYARRTEAAVYTIGLGISALDLSVRGKLEKLAGDTGGRSFFISRATELEGVYGSIEEELRSRYLVAYAPEPPPEPGSGYHKVEVKVRGRGMRARAQRGYYP